MANYTLELRQIVESCNYNLFDFEYNLYENTHKEEFEQKFIDYFYFDEIGFETVEKFKHRLRTKLNSIYDYYKQLYNIELATKDINFLKNKDLTETFTREVTGTGLNKTNSNTNSNMTSNNINEGFTSDTPQGRIEDIEQYMTNADKSKTNNSSNVSDTSIVNNENNTTMIETTTFNSKGDIGVQTAADAVFKWRESLINIDLMIFEELRELFMLIY